MKNRFSALALCMALAMGAVGTMAVTATPAMAAKEKAPKGPVYKLSKPVQSALAEAQKLQAEGNLDGALAKLAEAKAAQKTADDAFVTAQIKYNLASAKKDNALLEEASKEMLASESAPADLRRPLMQNLAAFAYQRGDMAEAIKRYQDLNAAFPGDPDIIVNLAEMHFKAKQAPQAVAMLQQAIDAKKAKNEMVPETWYKRMLAIAFDSKRMDLAVPASLSLVGAYPSQDNWRDSVLIFLDGVKPDDQTTLDAYRLMRAADALKGESDYYDYANSAYMKGLPGEAKAVIDEGVAKKALSATKPTFAELAKLSAGKVGADKAALPKLDTQARGAANGKLAMSTADGYLGYGEYAKAADLYRVALTKGSVDAAVVNTRLGIALARGGDKAGAKQAFSQVTTGPRAQLVKFWLAWLDRAA